ncbi:MAG: hypothetical protein CMD68_02390 [Gammaproteobacteria bacterium]|nr:hypothetical protein [Gammaproteobacteria bacterium]|tara:strand:- start:174 stop:518 length:345 start_codon:yes stop_codon:yes gene_type:complete
MLSSIGLLFFIPLLDYNFKGLISMIVICNGLLCHGSKYTDLSYQKKIMVYDVVCNVIMGLFVIYTSEHQTFTAIVFTISVFTFILNKIRYNSNSLLHVMGIQFPLSVALSFYQL